MYRLNVRDHLMIAHSLKGEVFGPAQRLHGATYVVDATFEREALDDDGLVVDIGLASAALKAVIEPWNYRNLDELPELAGRNTTTEYLARAIHERMAALVRDGALGPSAQGLSAIEITLHESHVAWASYRGAIG